MIKTTADFFDSYAHDFDAIYGSDNGLLSRIINRLFRTSMRLRYEMTITGCQPGDGKTALDIGCGPGHYGIVLAKLGMDRITGIDFAPGMIVLAKENALENNVDTRCDFITGDFLTAEFESLFDYVILMGFMDYVEDPRAVIERALSLTSSKAFFSFPADGGLLAWQRKIRYKSKCDLYMYTPERIESLFADLDFANMTVDRISRDYFVTISK